VIVGEPTLTAVTVAVPEVPRVPELTMTPARLAVGIGTVAFVPGSRV